MSKLGYLSVAFLSIIPLINSCLSDEYLYFSEEEKSYFFYDIGDTLIFVHKKDTIISTVYQKDFYMISGSSSYYSSKSDIHSEAGILRIKLIDNPGLQVLYMTLFKYENYAELYYEFSTENLKIENNPCFYNSGNFTSKIIDNKLTQYNSELNEEVIVEPKFDNIFELEDSYLCDYSYKLHLKKHSGFTSLVLSATDSILIKKQRNIFKLK